MPRLGANHLGYRGESIALPSVLSQLLAAARHHGWQVSTLPAGPDRELPILTRHASPSSGLHTCRIYLSTGIHGDEPAGPLAMLQLLADNSLPSSAAYWCCPCLNPSGFPLGTRFSADGVDLNRDYRSPKSPEIQAHVAWLYEQPDFDLTLCLHEDWEAQGFYIYELNPDQRPSLAPAMIQAVQPVCPIDLSSSIDGRTASGGVIRPVLDPDQRPEWPEALFLLQHRTRLSYTLEAPSDFTLAERTQALVAATRIACEQAVNARQPAAVPTPPAPPASGSSWTPPPTAPPPE